MIVKHNLTAMNSNRMLGINTATQAKSTEKLSSGYKINRAADDAAGLSISEKMRRQIRGLSQASLNAQDGISCVQTAEGALNEIHDMLQRINELAVKGENGTLASVDRSYIQSEVKQLMSEIDRVQSTTTFNEMNLLDGSFTNKGLQVGAESGQHIAITIANIGTNELIAKAISDGATFSVDHLEEDLDVASDGDYTDAGDVLTTDDEIYQSAGTKTLDHNMLAKFYDFDETKIVDVDLKTAIGAPTDIIFNNLESNTVDDAPTAADFAALNAFAKSALKTVSEQRSDLGAIQNRLEHTISNLDNVVENTTSAEAQIRDTDMATEMVKYSNNNILAQAGQAMLAQANQA
uniref:flagellin N-terminal helical domain-containing protein n=1 Tax=Acetatifactor sp. TaxID=1872090 RepID=UPI0040579C5B